MEIEYVFSAMLECRRCHEMVACCGTGGFEPEETPDEDGQYYTEFNERFFPRYFSSPMKILTIPRNCPTQCTDHLKRSFSVFFNDLGAAANCVRQFIEEILEIAGIHGRNSNGGFVPLGARINQYEEIEPDNTGRMSALRWIGNFGSHQKTLTKEDVFDAYDIIDVLLENLYVGHQRSVDLMVEQINAARGPRR